MLSVVEERAAAGANSENHGAAAPRGAPAGPPTSQDTAVASAAAPTPGPEVSAREVQQLREELEEARAAEAQLVREFRNYRRHAEADLASAKAKAQVELLAELAGTVQALELASASVDRDPDSVREGVALVARSLKKVFDAHGLQRIPAEGVAFDPSLHEAVLAEKVEGVARGIIVREVSPGFRTEDAVIRPAKVSVAA